MEFLASNSKELVHVRSVKFFTGVSLVKILDYL